MKNRKACPKCGSKDILIVDGSVGPYGRCNNILTGGLFSAVKVDRYICCSCGFTEEWIGREGIALLRNSKKAHR